MNQEHVDEDPLSIYSAVQLVLYDFWIKVDFV